MPQCKLTTLNYSIMMHEDRSHVPVGRTYQRATQIICTLGPSTSSVASIVRLLNAGMGIARLNFSHGTHEYHDQLIANVREACKRSGNICGILVDNKGPEVRTGKLEGGGPITYQEGSLVTITADYSAVGHASLIPVSYPRLAESTVPGNRILMADGTLMLEVEQTNQDQGTLLCRVLNTATIGERKNCNMPGIIIDMPILNEKDESDMQWAMQQNADFVAISFVRSGADVRVVRDFLGKRGRYIKIVAKIENQQGIDAIDEIIKEADGIMVARGDLGMEVPLERIFQIQKSLIRACNLAGKPVIIATQMLESMCHNPRPTRAEATDVANAVLDGTDCVMLSGETAAGRFPVEAVTIMSSIIQETERSGIDMYKHYKDVLRATMITMEQQRHQGKESLSPLEAMASSAATIVTTVQAKCIVALAADGKAARLVSKYRPNVPVVVGVIPRAARSSIGFQERQASGHQVARQLLITRGVYPVMIHPSPIVMLKQPLVAAQMFLDETLEFAREQGICDTGDNVVMIYNIENQGVYVKVTKCP